MVKPTEKAVRKYLSGYHEQHEDCERFKIKSVGPSPELNCLEAKVYTEWQTGDNVDNDFTLAEVATWTLWIEDGQVYGEY